MIVAPYGSKGPFRHIAVPSSMTPVGLPPPFSEVNMKRLCSFRGLSFLFAVVAFTLLRAPTAHAQGATISGLIVSESGQPLENANAYITELNISVAANAQGRYTI